MNKEMQLTYAPRSHQLTNIHIWTPDSQWIVFDVRPKGCPFTGLTIERVNVETGCVDVIYQASEGAHVGVVTVNPQLPVRYVFIHGPEHPDEIWHYDFHHRRGVIVTEPERHNAVTLDALDITPSFTPGALRGGSHVHVFSHDGSRVSFTYNDHIMHNLDPAYDLRNVGVAIPAGAVVVDKQHPREYSGSHFCVLVSQTTLAPEPGSDQISRAYEEGWIGHAGYYTSSHRLQRWALAFIGDTCTADGRKVAEIFVVDLPDELCAYQHAGELPLSGTATTMPAPPAGVKQRRITFTDKRRYPGIATTPRHWLRSSPNGQYIAFLMCDDFGVVQVWLVSPNGGELRQLTDGPHSVSSAFTWSPDGRHLAFVMDNSIVTCEIHSGVVTRLTERTVESPLPEAVVFSPNGRKIAYTREIDGFIQIFCIDSQCVFDNSDIVNYP